MKRILIFSHAMELGGVERALLGLLESIDTEKYKVDLFFMRHTGPLMQYIPDNINLLEKINEYSALEVPLLNVLFSENYKIGLKRLCGKICAKFREHELKYSPKNDIGSDYSHKYTAASMPDINPQVEYDLAISFLTPHYFTAQKVKAKTKIAWIHTDYSQIKIDTESERKMWEPYDYIISISEKTTEAFLKCFPEFADKIRLIENIQPVSLIKKQVEEFSAEKEMPHDDIRILSIGRFGYAKNFDNVPYILKEIRKSGLDVRWYLIGYGSDEELIRKNIKDAGMEDFVIILGKKTNPYPYIKECDLYVQPSRFEGNCVSVREAQLLHKPVVITAYPTSSSQLKNGTDGIIVPLDNEGCAKGIIEVLKNKPLQEKLIENMKNTDYSNSEEINKITALIK